MVRASGTAAYLCVRAVWRRPRCERRGPCRFGADRVYVPELGAERSSTRRGCPMSTDRDLYPTDTAGLAAVSRPPDIRLADGDNLGLSIGPVRKELRTDDPGPPAELRMLAYNGSIPGPTL